MGLEEIIGSNEILEESSMFTCWLNEEEEYCMHVRGLTITDFSTDEKGVFSGDIVELFGKTEVILNTNTTQSLKSLMDEVCASIRNITIKDGGTEGMSLVLDADNRLTQFENYQIYRFRTIKSIQIVGDNQLVLTSYKL